MARQAIRIPKIAGGLVLKDDDVLAGNSERLIVQPCDHSLGDRLDLGVASAARPDVDLQNYFGAVDAIGLVGKYLSIAQRNVWEHSASWDGVINPTSDHSRQSTISL